MSTEDEEEDCDDSNTLNRSCPVLRNPDENFAEMKKALSDLRLKLDVADNEISNLLQENSLLKKQIGEYENKIVNLTRICKSVPKKTPSKRDSLHDISSTPELQEQGKSFSNIQHKNSSTQEKGAYNNNKYNTLNYESIQGSSTSNDNGTKPRLTSGYEEKKPRIFILGDEQLRGLSAKLSASRFGKWNDVYKTSGVIKPHAPSSHLLSNLGPLSDAIHKEDILVVSTGSYDDNPHTLYSNLCNLLYQFRHCKKVFLLSVPLNKFLNLRTLNSDLQLLSTNYSNCNFIDLDKLKKNYSIRIPLSLIAYKINLEIDSIKYEQTYLKNVLKLNKSLPNVKCSYSTQLGNDSNVERFFRL